MIFNLRAKHVLAGVIMLIGQLFFQQQAHANAVVSCDGCTFSSYITTAKNAGLGYVYVMDTTNARVKLYNVTQDSTGYRLASPLTVPAGVQSSFLEVLNEKVSGKANVVVTIRPTDTFPNWAFINNPFGAFTNSNAYSIAGSNSSQTSLGVNVANAFTGTTGNATLDSLGQTLISTLMGLDTPIVGPITFTIVMVWNDGSRTTYTISSDTVTEAAYEAGESRDPNGVRIPDQSVNTSDGGPAYAGGYGFPNNNSLNNWLTAANLAGIPITGPNTGSRSLRCSWDGQTLTCKFV